MKTTYECGCVVEGECPRTCEKHGAPMVVRTRSKKKKSE